MTDQALDLKKRFVHSYELDLIVAKRCVVEYIENLQLHDLDTKQKIRQLTNARELLFLEADAFGRKDYLIFADNQDCLYNVFFSHYLIYKCYEESLLLEGLVLFEKLKCINQLLSAAKKEYPPFASADFSQEKENILLYELDERPRDMSQKDYYKILNCCIQKKGECVNLDFESIRKRFIESVKDNPKVMDEVISKIQLVDDLFENRKTITAPQLYDLLSKLTGLAPCSLPEDKAEFHRLFCQFDPKKNFYHALSPQFLHLAHERIREGKLSPVPVCCYSLIKFKRWLTTVLKGEIGMNDPPDTHYELLVEKCYQNNIDLSKKLILFFQMNYPYGKMNKDQYKSLLLEELKKCRKHLNELKYPEYYHLLLNRENTKNYFIDQCWLDIDIEDHSCQLGKTILYNEMTKFYIGKLSHFDQSLVYPTLNIVQIKNDFELIISIMVPSPRVIQRLWKAFNKFSFGASSRKPLLFMVEDLKDIIDEIFREAMKDLIDLLEAQPGVVIETYVKKMLMELDQRQLIKPEFGQGLDKYIMDLQRFSEMKLKYSPVLQSSPLDNNETPFSDLQMQVIKPEIPKIGAFNCNNINDDRISTVMNSLIKLGAIPEDTTFAHFNSKYNGKNGTDPIEWLASQGDFATFIKESIRINEPEFASYNQHWNIASNCFVQKGGIAFDPQKLRCSKPTMLEQKFIKAARKFK